MQAEVAWKGPLVRIGELHEGNQSIDVILTLEINHATKSN